MYNRHCDICDRYNAEYNFVIRLTDDKNKVDINGHEKCINETSEKIKLMDKKWKVDKVLKELRLDGIKVE